MSKSNDGLAALSAGLTLDSLEATGSMYCIEEVEKRYIKKGMKNKKEEERNNKKREEERRKNKKEYERR
mgnify:CR=1 FL=1